MKSRILLLIYLVLVVFIINFSFNYAQEFHGSVMMPVYKGGLGTLKEFIVKNNHSVIEGENKNCNKGVVTLKYTVNEKGSIENIKILRGISAEYDSEAVRIARLISGWNPAVQWGKEVSTNVIMPVEFCLKVDDTKIQTLSGNVCNKVTGAPIEGTLVLVKGTNVGAITDKFGNYSLPAQSENSVLDFSSLGYSLKSEKVNKNHTINVELLPEDFIIEFPSN
jgi:TonB family protein